MAKENYEVHAYRITAKQYLKIKRRAEKRKVSQSHLIRNLIEKM